MGLPSLPSLPDFSSLLLSSLPQRQVSYSFSLNEFHEIIAQQELRRYPPPQGR
jgi:hypothetical protein